MALYLRNDDSEMCLIMQSVRCFTLQRRRGHWQ